jgi:hypothetical protein
MIGKGHPTSKQNTKELAKNGAVVFFATDSNLLFVRENGTWIALGHVAHDLHSPAFNQGPPRLQGHPY